MDNITSHHKKHHATTITLASETVREMCTRSIDADMRKYRAQMDALALEPQQREDFIKERGYGRFAKWFWMSSDRDFRERLRRDRQWARDKLARDSELARVIFSAASHPEMKGKLVTMSASDFYSLIQWSIDENVNIQLVDLPNPEWDL